eukprot:scaffold932_cov328-Pavlova_lutheri.AAC.50
MFFVLVPERSPRTDPLQYGRLPRPKIGPIQLFAPPFREEVLYGSRTLNSHFSGTPVQLGRASAARRGLDSPSEISIERPKISNEE